MELLQKEPESLLLAANKAAQAVYWLDQRLEKTKAA